MQRTVGMSNLLLPSFMGFPVRCCPGPPSFSALPADPGSVPLLHLQQALCVVDSLWRDSLHCARRNARRAPSRSGCLVGWWHSPPLDPTVLLLRLLCNVQAGLQASFGFFVNVCGMLKHSRALHGPRLGFLVFILIPAKQS